MASEAVQKSMPHVWSLAESSIQKGRMYRLRIDIGSSLYKLVQYLRATEETRRSRRSIVTNASSYKKLIVAGTQQAYSLTYINKCPSVSTMLLVVSVGEAVFLILPSPTDECARSRLQVCPQTWGRGSNHQQEYQDHGHSKSQSEEVSMEEVSILLQESRQVEV